MITTFIWDVDNDAYLGHSNDEGAMVTLTLEPSPFGNMISQHDNGGTAYFHLDGIHSARELSDEAMNIISEFVYTAFGEELAASVVLTVPFRYKGCLGYYTSAETGYVYVRSRAYSSSLGRWLSNDPRGLSGGEINLFRYVGNHATSAVDPSGEVEFKITPKEVDSMDWYSSTFGGKGEVGRTILLNFAAPWAGMRYGCEGKGKVKFTVKGDIHIRLDEAEIRRTKTSKERAYGHEQVHVKNVIIIIKREAKILAEVEDQVFDTPQDLEIAAKQAIDKFSAAVKAAYKRDGKHNSTDPMSPPDGKGVDPIGTMPKNPKGIE